MWLESNCYHAHDVVDTDNNGSNGGNGNNGSIGDNGKNDNSNHIYESKSSTSSWLHRWLFNSHNIKKKKHNSTTSHESHDGNKISISKPIWYMCLFCFFIIYT